ncbi:hypothetical protein Glove_117g311 [Diversispora epigaea]|uniref:non-specific serine/threonine protein kinase n=1 Tax=Diversispora epigaea TaxID=1348612 RepID=A0A397J969_9GLOM|nr:hypothetical protein Glove_117g311 [Diversispora epigaea]
MSFNLGLRYDSEKRLKNGLIWIREKGHSSEDLCSDQLNYINFDDGTCYLCSREHFIQEFKTWSSGNVSIDKIIQESQISSIYRKSQWIPYDNFQNIKHIADGKKVALKEIKDSRFDIVEFLKVMNIINDIFDFIVVNFGISKNPSTQNYIIVMELFCENFHNFLTKTFWDLGWKTKIDLFLQISLSLASLHAENLVHCGLHSGNILNEAFPSSITSIDLECKLENNLILNANNKYNKIYGSIPYIPPEVLRGNEFTRKGDIYSFGGIMYEIVTAQRPFADQAHDTYLMIDICNGVRPKVPDFMLNWIPEWYLDLMYRCWSDDPSERPTAAELCDLFCEISNKLNYYRVDNNVMQQLDIADENQQNISKSQKQELFELFSHSNMLHPQSYYIGRSIHTLHGLCELLEEIKSGKSSDPNLLKLNESIILKHIHINPYINEGLDSISYRDYGDWLWKSLIKNSVNYNDNNDNINQQQQKDEIMKENETEDG